jgi:hypothetical protein
MFPGGGDIWVYGKWEMHNTSGKFIDRAQERVERACHFVHRIIDSPVHRYAIDAPTSFNLYIENGCSLTVFDNSEQFESFSIQPDGIYV